MAISNQALLEFFSRRQAWALEILRKLVLSESPTSDKEAVDRLGLIIESQITALGATIERIPQEGVGHHLMGYWTFDPVPKEKSPVLLLGHIDTVWPVGQIHKMPIRSDGDKLFGPGILDMKASVVLMLLILRAFRELPIFPKRPINILLTADEEIGSEMSKSVIEHTAAGCSYVLCMEPPLPGNIAKTQRKGVYRVTLAVHGMAAHAGVDHEKGVNAIEELAHQIIRLQSMTDYAAGTTINVGTIRAENATNVVPDYAVAEIDVRATSRKNGEEVLGCIESLQPVNKNTRLELIMGANRPPLERTEKLIELYKKAALLAKELGFVLGEGATGGGSDGSLTAAMGITTLDGMGVDGAGPHSLNEHIRTTDIAQKAALLTRIIETV